MKNGFLQTLANIENTEQTNKDKTLQDIKKQKITGNYEIISFYIQNGSLIHKLFTKNI